MVIAPKNNIEEDRNDAWLDHSKSIYDAIQSTVSTKSNFKHFNELNNDACKYYCISSNENQKYIDAVGSGNLNLPQMRLLKISYFEFRKQMQSQKPISDIYDKFKVINNICILGVDAALSPFDETIFPEMSNILKILFDKLKAEPLIIRKNLGTTYRYNDEQDSKVNIRLLTVNGKKEVIIITTPLIKPIKPIIPTLIEIPKTCNEIDLLERRANEIEYQLYTETELERVYELERQIEEEKHRIFECELENEHERELERVKKIERIRAVARETERKLEFQRQYAERMKLRIQHSQPYNMRFFR